MDQKHEKSVKELESRFQFLITLALFFPLIISNLYILAGGGEKSSAITILQWGIFISLLLAAYLIFIFLKKKTSSRFLSTLNIFVLINIFLFIPNIVIFAYNTQSLSLTGLTKWSLLISFNLLLWFPAAIFLLVSSYGIFILGRLIFRD
jgi:hypothetical protein